MSGSDAEERRPSTASRRMRCNKPYPACISSCNSAPTTTMPRRSVGRVGRRCCCLLVQRFWLCRVCCCWASHGSQRCTSAAILALSVPASPPSLYALRFGTAKFVVLARIDLPSHYCALPACCCCWSFVPASSPVRHSRAPDYCARIAREHRAPRSNICACAGTSGLSRLALHDRLLSIPSHAAVAAALALHCTDPR